MIFYFWYTSKLNTILIIELIEANEFYELQLSKYDQQK